MSALAAYPEAASDFLTSRMMELAVHLDDLAVSVGLATPEFPDAAFDPVLVLLTRLAAPAVRPGRAPASAGPCGASASGDNAI